MSGAILSAQVITVNIVHTATISTFALCDVGLWYRSQEMTNVLIVGNDSGAWPSHCLLSSSAPDGVFSNNFSRKYWRIFLVTLNLREVYLSLFSSISFFPLPDTELVSVGGRSLEGILVWGLFLLRSSSGPTGDKVTGQSPSSSVLWYSHTASLLVYCPGNLSILSSQFKLPCSSPDKARTVKWSLRLCPGFQGKNMK